jgi:hypothetical protein
VDAPDHERLLRIAGLDGVVPDPRPDGVAPSEARSATAVIAASRTVIARANAPRARTTATG